MLDDRTVVDLIERAHDATPYCPCGAHTTPVEHGGVIWLDCAKLAEPAGGHIQRLLHAWIPHVHREIIDLGEEGFAAA
jgi:hypothetical protein